MDEGLTVRDVSRLLRRSARLLVGVPLLAASVVFGVSLAVPKTFESLAGASLTVSLPPGSPSGASLWLANLPSASALAESLARRPDISESTRGLEVRYDERKGLLTFIARAPSASRARENAGKALGEAETFLRERLAAAATANLRAASAQARVDLAAAECGLRDVRALRKEATRSAAPPLGTTAALEAAGLDPRFARAPEPARAFLDVQEARLAADLALSRARAAEAEGILADPATLGRLVDQAFHFEILTPPTEPSGPRSPRPVLNAGLAAFFGLVLVLLGIFVRDAIEAGR